MIICFIFYVSLLNIIYNYSRDIFPLKPSSWFVTTQCFSFPALQGGEVDLSREISLWQVIQIARKETQEKGSAERMMTMSKMMYIEYSGYQFLMIKLLINITTQASMVNDVKERQRPLMVQQLVILERKWVKRFDNPDNLGCEWRGRKVDLSKRISLWQVIQISSQKKWRRKR